MEIGIWDSAQRLLREYGDMAEQECEARATYHEIQGDKAVAEGWRRTAEIIQRLRSGQLPPKD